MIRIGCIGYGAWGRNLARVAASTPGAQLVAIAERDDARRAEAARRHPEVTLYPTAKQLLAADTTDAVIVVTDAGGHADLVVQAVARGRHVFVEKPLALDVAAAERAVAAAAEHKRVLQVGHLMRYHPAVELLFDVARRELGGIRCVAAQRLNFGTVRADENVLFSLGPHDLSIMLELFGAEPETVAAQGACFVRPGIEDLCFVTLRFPGGRIGQMHLSWLDPHKVRRVTVVGEAKMAVFDDMEPREKVRVHDQGVDSPPGFLNYGENLSLRTGEIHIPSFRAREPLSVELEHFVSCIANGTEPRTSGAEGVAVVRVLAAAQESMRRGGIPLRLAEATT